MYSAKHILDGAEIGVEEKPSAKLGTLTLNMLGVKLCGFSDTGPKIVQMVLQLAALALMFFAVKRVFGILPAGVSVIIASSYLSAPFIAKFGNVKEQYMIAFMVMGISCFVMRQTGGKWFWALLAGGFVSWAPLFKETGTTVIGAIGLFVIAQPILKSCHLILIRLFGVKISIRQLIRTWKQTGIEILLLSAGAIAAISPFYIWILGWNIKIALPYSFVWKILIPAKAGSDTIGGSYISGARQLRSFSEQLPIVLRYYWLLILPIALALGAILAGIVRVIVNIVKIIMEIVTKTMKNASADQHDSLVLLFAVWWLLDMAFVWISPRSYEQYYLPLCASAAMLGAYLIAIYSRLFSRQFNRDFFKSTEEIVKRVFIIVILVFIGIIGMIMMSTLSWHVFFGIKQSPYSGIIYTNAAGKPEGRNGYAQRLREISSRRRALRKNLDGKYPWEEVGEYIRDNSSENDKIFVWGWYPGIYVAAQRLAPTSWPFTSEMHTKTPERFANDIKALLAELEQERPKYIVDSRKQHFPYDRPPLELWPISEYQILQRLGIPTTEPDKAYKAYAEWLAKTYGPDEAGRFMAMKPFREFIRKNYELVQAFGPHILFKLKTSPAGQE
ncbi:MAG: glycosyltransferase family 39 protein [Sedimentisphaerales bacterium]|nr:glycosyltransferase family 39 protein [Sedimentisphaerales bacterium]